MGSIFTNVAGKMPATANTTDAYLFVALVDMFLLQAYPRQTSQIPESANTRDVFLFIALVDMLLLQSYLRQTSKMPATAL